MKTKDLTICDSIWITENGISKEYFVIKKDDDGVVVLRRWLNGTHRMNPSNTTAYEGSEMDTWLQNSTNGYMSLFSADIRACFVERSINWHKYDDSEVSQIRRSIFLLSLREATNSQAQSLEPEEYLGELIKHKCGGSLACSQEDATAFASWWLRSPNSATSYCCINTSGSSNGNSPSSAYGVRPALNLSADAEIVRDEVTGKYHLSAEQRTYGLIEFKINAGTSVQRPKKVKVEIDSNSTYDTVVKVCNNYADATPDWVACNENGYAELDNVTKGSESWVIGVLVSAKTTSIGTGYIDEPIVLMEVD